MKRISYTRLFFLLIAVMLFIVICASCSISADAPSSPDTPTPAPEENYDNVPPQTAPAEYTSPPETPKITEGTETNPAETAPSVNPSAPTASTAPTAGTSVTSPPGSGNSDFEISSPSMLTETADMGQDYLDRIIFLGDSTTYGLKYYKMLSGGKETMQVWTPSSGTLTLSYQGFATIVYPRDGTEITIRDAVIREMPEYMIITLGVNGVSFMDETYFKAEYTSLVNDIKELSPNTKIILQSIFPIAENYEHQSSINNQNISAANRWVCDIAEECGVRFLNTASVLVGADGWLPEAYQNGDGIHLNSEGFGKVINYIRTHGYP
ncbi:MAG: hypothetical protein GXY20_00155 [Clostridiales bacterium]|nr:hypothetical protein [Clostridiales bacterium]